MGAIKCLKVCKIKSFFHVKETGLRRPEGKNRCNVTLFFRGKERLVKRWQLDPITVITAKTTFMNLLRQSGFQGVTSCPPEIKCPFEKVGACFAERTTVVITGRTGGYRPAQSPTCYGRFSESRSISLVFHSCLCEMRILD